MEYNRVSNKQQNERFHCFIKWQLGNDVIGIINSDRCLYNNVFEIVMKDT